MILCVCVCMEIRKTKVGLISNFTSMLHRLNSRELGRTGERARRKARSEKCEKLAIPGHVQLTIASRSAEGTACNKYATRKYNCAI